MFNGQGWATVSIGVASLTPSTGKAPGTLIAKADEALYYAKSHGRNNVRLAQE